MSATVVIIGNIPAAFRTADLRAFFSEAVECAYFLAFHFVHRPERRCGAEDHERARTNCCVIKVKRDFLCRFVSKYHAVAWRDRRGVHQRSQCPPGRSPALHR